MDYYDYSVDAKFVMVAKDKRNDSSIMSARDELNDMDDTGGGGGWEESIAQLLRLENSFTSHDAYVCY